MEIVIFEDEGYKNLLPLVYFRPVWELRCGALSLYEKIKLHFPGYKLQFLCRKYLADNCLNHQGIIHFDNLNEILFLNGRLLIRHADKETIMGLDTNQALVCDEQIVAFKISGKSLKDYINDGILLSENVLNDLSFSEHSAKLINYPWHLVEENGNELYSDFTLMGLLGLKKGKIDPRVSLMNEDQIYVGQGARIMPGTVINAEDGPVLIDEGVKIMPNVFLEGPLFIGKNSVVKVGAKIYENTSIGPVCKVGGEIENCIIQGYSNKQHEGFLGHSYLGSWVNIGADTNNSDLKNNYGEITVFLNGYPVATGKQFLGLIMGDHSKTAINTMFNTGTIVGVNCNVYGSGFPPKFIPSFSWGGSGGLREFQFEKAVEVAERMMKRRNIDFTEKDFELFKAVKNLAEKIENRVRVR